MFGGDVYGGTYYGGSGDVIVPQIPGVTFGYTIAGSADVSMDDSSSGMSGWTISATAGGGVTVAGVTSSSTDIEGSTVESSDVEAGRNGAV